MSAERICLPFPRPGARDRGRINAAPVAQVYLDLFCKVWFWGEAGTHRDVALYDVHKDEESMKYPKFYQFDTDEIKKLLDFI